MTDFEQYNMKNSDIKYIKSDNLLQDAQAIIETEIVQSNEIFHTVSGNFFSLLTWTHYRTLLQVKSIPLGMHRSVETHTHQSTRIPLGMRLYYKADK